MKWLSRSGLIAPDEIAANEDYIPLDFTSLNGRELGAVHSRYAVRHAHGLYELAKLKAEEAGLTKDIKMEEAKFRALHKKHFNTKWELDDAMLMDDDLMILHERRMLAEIRSEIVEGIVKGYEGLTRAASREITRRTGEQAPRD